MKLRILENVKPQRKAKNIRNEGISIIISLNSDWTEAARARLA